MPGKWLNSQAQEFVINLIEYYEMEKNNGGPFQPISSSQEESMLLHGYGDERVLSMWKEALENCSANVWDNCVRHPEKIIKDWFTREQNLVEIHIEPVIINTGEDSSDSETDEL